MKYKRLVSKIEGKTNFSRRLKQFDGLSWLTLMPMFYSRSTPLGMSTLLHCFGNMFYFTCTFTKYTSCRVESMTVLSGECSSGYMRVSDSTPCGN